MAKKPRDRNRPPTAESEPTPALPKTPERISSPFRDALGPLKKQLDEAAKKKAEQAKAPPPPPPPPKPIRRAKSGDLPEDDAMALSLAMHGVVPLADKKAGRVGTSDRVESRTAKVAPFRNSAEDEARARLEALVAQDVNFRIERDGDYVSAARADAPPRVARELARRPRASETLDLHGMSGREARDAVVSFIRKTHKKGLDVVCIVHGKGQHSEDGRGVLRDVVIRALTDTGAATLVRAFATPSEALGGTGALLVELQH